MSTSTSTVNKEALGDALERAFVKPGRPRSATAIRTKRGETYYGTSISSDSHLLDIVAEHAALMLLIQHNDFELEHVSTLTEEETVSPIALKILVDYAARVGGTFGYSVYSTSGAVLFETTDIHTALPHYRSPMQPLTHVRERAYTQSIVLHADSIDAATLGAYALHGAQHHFLSAETGSLYGCAIASKDGRVFTSGAYGSPDKRLGLHAEMAALVVALLHEARDVTHIAIASTKYTDSLCPFCGHCRQLISEVLAKIGGTPTLISVASETNDYKEYTLDELLPHQWTSKKW